MLASIWAAITAIPKLLDLIEKLMAALESHQRELQAVRINDAEKHANEAKTDEERIKAAREFAEAQRHL